MANEFNLLKDNSGMIHRLLTEGEGYATEDVRDEV
jgi:hypothetical protein